MDPKATGIELDDDLSAALVESPVASQVFDGLPPSHKRRYVEWISEARGAETRTRRIKKTIEMLRETHTR